MTTAAILDARSMRAWLARYLEWMRVRHHSERYVDTARKQLGQFFAWCDTRGLVRPEETTRPILERYQRFIFHYRKADGRPLAYATALIQGCGAPVSCTLPVAAGCWVTIRGSRVADRGSRTAAGHPAEIGAGGRVVTE